MKNVIMKTNMSVTKMRILTKIQIPLRLCEHEEKHVGDKNEDSDKDTDTAEVLRMMKNVEKVSWEQEDEDLELCKHTNSDTQSRNKNSKDTYGWKASRGVKVQRQNKETSRLNVIGK